MKEEQHKEEEEDIDFPPPPVCTRLPPRPAISKTSSPPNKELSPASDCHPPETDHHLLLNGGQTEEIKVNIRSHLDSSSPHNCTTTTTIPPSFVEGVELAEHVKEQHKASTIEKTLVVKSNSNCFKTPALPSEGKKPSRCSPSVKKRQKTTASADPTTEVVGKYLLSCNNGQPKRSPANGTSATLAAAAAAVFSFNSLTAAAAAVADVALVKYSNEELLRDFVAIGKHSFLCPRSQQFLAKRYPGLVLRRATMKTAAENHRLEAEEGEEEAAAVEEDIINEIVIDEFSLLLFRSLDDYNVLKDREDAIKAEEETAEKQRQHEENLRMNRVKKKGRRSLAELKREKKEAKKRVRQERKEQRKKEREERRQQRKLALQTSQNSSDGADAGGLGGPMAQLAEDMAERKRQRREQRKEAKVAEREKRREERRRQRQTKRGEDKRAKRIISNKSGTVPCAPNAQPSSDITSSTSSSSCNAVENVVSGLLRLRDGGLLKSAAEHDGGSPVNFKPQQLPSSSSSTAEMVAASIATSTTTAAAAAAATKRPSSATIGIAATRRNGLMRPETTAGLLQCMPPASKMAKLEDVKLEEFGGTTPSSNRSLLIGIAGSNGSGAMQLQQTVPTDASFAQQTKTLHQQHQNVFKAALERDLVQKVSDAVPSLQQGGGSSTTTGHLPHADQQQLNPCDLAYNFHQSLATLYAIDPSLAAKAALGLPSAPFGGDSAAAHNKANNTMLQQSSQKLTAVSDLSQQQQHQLVVNNGRVLGVDAAALGLPSTSAVLPPPSSASAASCGVSNPPPPPLDSHPANLIVASQKVGRPSAAVAPTSASIQQTNAAAVHIPFKNGRWCNMHATIAHEIAKHVEAQKKIANVRTTNTAGSHRKQSTTTSATGCAGREHQQKTERKPSSVSVATSSSFPAQQSNEQQQQNNKNGSRGGANNAMANASAPTMAQHHQQLLQLQQEQGKRTGNNLLPNSASASAFPMLSAASANLNLQQQIALLMGQQQQQQQRISTFNDSSPLHSHGVRFPVQGANLLGPFASSSGPLNALGGLSQFLSANSVHPSVGSMPPHLFGGFPIQPMGPGAGSLTSGNSDAAAAAQLHQHAQLLTLLQQQSNNNLQQQHHPASLSAAFALQPNSNNNNINSANDSNNASAAAATQCAMANNFLAQFGASSVASNSAANSNATNNINTMVAAGAGGHQQQLNNNNNSSNMLSSLVAPANLAFAANILNPTALPSLQQQQNSLALSQQMANTGSNNSATAAGGAHALMHSGTFSNNNNNNSGGNEATGAESILAAFLSGQPLVTSSASNALNSSNPAMGIEQFVRSQFGGRMDGPPMMALGNQMQLSKMTASNLIPPPPSALLSAGHLSVNPASVINPIEQELLMMRHFGLVNQRSQQLLGASLSGAGMDSLPPQNGPPKQDTGVISTANGATAAAAAHNRHDMSRT